MKKYDLIVIGSGGGAQISTPAAKLGKKVAIIEKDKLGGTCLNRGCIPSKMLIHPANVMTAAKEAAKFGFSGADALDVDFSKLIARISKSVDDNSAGIAPAYEKIPTLDYYKHEARFVSDRVIAVGDEKITADTIIIATGARPNIPDIPGLAGTPYMTSAEALRAEKRPQKLLVIGGGYIACELGNAYGAFGSHVEFFVRGELLEREDSDVRKVFTETFTKKYVVHDHTADLSVRYDNRMFTLTGKDATGSTMTVMGDQLLVATGITPNSDLLGLENTRIQRNENGFVSVNNYLETAVPGVYALGDVVGNFLFRHSVNFEGEYLFSQLFGSAPKGTIVYPPMPHAIFTSPEIASVGKTEDELQKEGKKYVSGRCDYTASAQGMARLPGPSFAKLLFDRQTKKLLGAHIIGEEAATMIHHALYAMTFNATVDDLLAMIYIHPSLLEIVRNAARKARAQF